MARAAVIPTKPSPKRATRTTKRTTATTSTSRSAGSGVSKPVAKTTRTKAAGATTETRKRGVRAAATPIDEDSDDGTDDELNVIEPTRTKPTPAKARGRPAASGGTTRGRKAATPVISPKEDSDVSEDNEAAPVELPKKRAGRPKAKAAPKPEEPAKSETAPRTRGRPKGSTNKATRAAAAEKTSATEQNPKEVLITTNSTLIKSNILRGPAKKKKVTFQDPSDSDDMSEPSPPPPTGRRRPATTGRQTGLAAKPARKAASTPARGRKPAAAKKGASKPLSPKKATQVAKSLSSYASSDGEDDELSAKSPIKLVVNSPQRHGSETTGLSSPVKRINFTSAQPPPPVDENGEPAPRQRRSIDFNDTLLMSSPARRPPPSPFNYTVRETPRRGGFALRDDPKPLAQPNFTPMQNSPLKSSPRKAHLGTPRLGSLGFNDSNPLSQPDFTPGQNSPLKSSPRKGLFGASFSSHAPQESSTPLKSRSLLMSPAKKVASPFKRSALAKYSPLVERSLSDNEHNTDIDSAKAAAHDESPLRPLELEDEMEVEVDDEMGEITDDLKTELKPEPENFPQVSLGEGDGTEDEPWSPNDDDDDDGAPPLGSHEVMVDHAGSPEKAPQLEAHEPMNEPTEASGVVDEGHDEEPLEGYEPQDVDNGSDHNEAKEDTPEVQAEFVEFVPQEFEEHSENVVEEISEDAVDEHDECDLAVEFESIHAASKLFEIDDQPTSDAAEEEDHADEPVLAPMTVDDPDTFDTQPFQHDEYNQEYATETESDAEIEGIDKLWGSPYRQSLVAGLEDVFMDMPLTLQAPMAAEETEDDEGTQSEDDNLDDFVGQPEEGHVMSHELSIIDATGHEMLESEAIVPYEIDEMRSSSVRSSFVENLLPPAPSPPKTADCAEYRDLEVRESDTEDLESEIEQGQLHDDSVQSPVKPEQQKSLDHAERRRTGPRFTLLAEQLSGWKASSPEKSQPSRPRRRGVFSLAGNLQKLSDTVSDVEVSYPSLPVDHQSPPISSPVLPANNSQDATPHIFEDPAEEPEIHEDDPRDVVKSSRPPLFEIFEDSQLGPTEGGAEESPAIPSKGNSPVRISPPAHEEAPDDEKENENILPAPSTPAKKLTNPMHTFHTVSKVPLKPEGHISPLKMPRKRGRSLSMTSPVRSSPRIRKSILVSQEQKLSSPSPRKSPKPQRVATPQLQPRSGSRSRMSMGSNGRRSSIAPRSPSPSKTPKPNNKASQQVLGGAVVFVDVHTTEGEDASGIFIELLQQMGARCVKNWAWNPRASVSPAEEHMPKDGRIGITHVVYKDGGVRTLEKVRQAGGVVKCVGVGWVLDCERENKWLDESQYSVDSSIIPRGGGKRRKSMEPRALSNVNGTLVKGGVGAAGGRRSGADREAMQDFMRQTPPLLSRDGSSVTPESSTPPQKSLPGHTEADQEFCQTPQTPGSSGYDFANLDRIGMSPATPYYLSQRSRLVQQTCPPKQTQQGLFSTPGPREESSHLLRARLEAARRRSLAFKPKVGSPLIE